MNPLLEQQKIEAYKRRLEKLKRRAWALLKKHPEGLTIRQVEKALHRERVSRRLWEEAFAGLLVSRWVVKTLKPSRPKQHFGLTTLQNAERLQVVPGIDPLTEERLFGSARIAPKPKCPRFLTRSVKRPEKREIAKNGDTLNDGSLECATYGYVKVPPSGERERLID